VFLRIRDDQTHTAHCTQHTTIQASINRNSTMVSTHIRSAEGRKTDTHTDKKPEYRKFSTVRLRTSFECLTTGKSGDLSLVASPLFSPGILIREKRGYIDLVFEFFHSIISFSSVLFTNMCVSKAPSAKKDTHEILVTSTMA